MTKKNIALIGFMGVGKTLVSNRLEELLNMEVVSTDQMIVDLEGRSIVDIFRDKGEAYFRLLEKRVVKELCQRENVIIDCGGGVVLDSENFEILNKTCHVVYLSATADTIYENIKTQTDRPLLNVDDPKAEIARLLEIRSPYYERAEFIVDANDPSIDRMAEKVMKVINEGK